MNPIDDPENRSQGSGDPDVKRWGKQIRKLRENRLGITQGEFAQRISDEHNLALNRATLSKWEQGLFAPHPRYRPAIGAVLGVDAELLFQRIDRSSLNRDAA